MSFPLIDFLSQIVDYQTGATIYQCGKREIELDLSFERPSHSIELPGVDAPYDPLGAEGNPMATRKVAFKFTHLYDDSLTVGTSPTLPATARSRRQDFNRAVGDGRRVYLVLTDGDGKQWYGLGKLLSSANKITADRRIRADFDGVFELNPPVFRTLYPSGWAFFDAGLFFDDAGFANFDVNTLPTLPLTATTQQTTVTNAGDAYEQYLTIYIRGPFTGPVTIFNTSVILPNGAPMQFTYTGSLGIYQTLVVDLAAGTFRIDGVPAYDPQVIFKAKGQRPWFYLLPGANVLQANLSAAGIYGQLGRVDVTTPGTGYLGLPTVAITGGTPQRGATAHAVISGGAVTSVVVDDGGAFYLSTPTITFSGGGGTTQATGHAVLSTVVSSVVIGAGGSGYTSAPTPVFGGGGTGAVGVATIANGQVTGVTVTHGGTGYTYPTTVTFTGGGGTGASGGANLTSGVVTSIVVDTPGAGYVGFPTVTLTPVSGGTGGAAHAVLDGTGGVGSVILDAPGNSYGLPPTVAITGGNGAGTVATATAVVGGSVQFDSRDTRF